MMRSLALFLLPLLALTASGAAADTPTEVELHLSNFKIVPQTLKLVHGKAYTLRIINDARGGHSLLAKTFFGGAKITPKDMLIIKNGEIEVAGGQARLVRFLAPAPGSYPMKCGHMMHDGFGMTGTIIVE